jgi:hypothetical protein
MYDHEVYSSMGLSTILQVVPDPSSSVWFQLRSEEFLSINETGDANNPFGSDEIGIRITMIQALRERKPGPMDSFDFEFGDVDSGDRFRMDQTHFDSTTAYGFGFSVVGFEIDNEKAYEEAIREFSDVFQLIMESNWAKIADAVGAGVGKLVNLFSSDNLSKAIGEAVSFGIKVAAGLWAPADLVIEDSGGVSFLRAVELTSLGFANPPPEQQRSQGGIYVLAEPCEDTADLDRLECNASAKTLHELGTFASYRERRQYSSFPPEIELPLGLGHSFQITFEYDRLQ